MRVVILFSMCLLTAHCPGHEPIGDGQRHSLLGGAPELSAVGVDRSGRMLQSPREPGTVTPRDPEPPTAPETAPEPPTAPETDTEPPESPTAEAPAEPEPGTTAETPGTQPPAVPAEPKIVLPAGFSTAQDNAAVFGEPGYTIVHEATGMEFVWVPAGEFDMGAYGGNPDATPVRKVTISCGMWFGKHEVTNAQFRQFCLATRTAFPAGSDAGPRHPVVLVSWDDAHQFAEHYGMRLPTEAEWEYAARGPSGGSLPWGERWNESLACAADNRGPDGRSYPVGSFPEGASWCGALDMAGNVFEWCADWYHHRIYSGGDNTDPQGPATGAYRVVRGGSFANPAPLCRTYIRSKYPPNYAMRHLGFRCVLSQPAQIPAGRGLMRSPRTAP